MVRPIDLQDNLSKAPIAGRLQQLQQDRPEMALRESNQQAVRQQRADRSRPLPAEESQKVTILPKGGERRQRRDRQRDNPDVPGTEAGARPGIEEDEEPSPIDIIA